MADSCPYDAGSMVYLSHSILMGIDTVPTWTQNDCELTEEPPSARYGQEEEPVDEQIGEKTNDFRIYPNPNNGQFNVVLGLEHEETAHIEVFNVAGKRVHTEGLNAGHNTIQLQVAEGLYLYRVSVNDEPQWTGKLSVGMDQ